VDINQYISSGIIERYVLGMLSAEEEAELLQLRSRHPALKAAIDAFEQQHEAQALRHGVNPPASVKQRLMDRLEDEFDSPMTTASPAPFNPSPTPPNVPVFRIPAAWRYAAAAMIMANLALSGWLWTRYRSLNNSYAQLQSEYAELKTSTEAIQQRYNTAYADVRIISDSAMMVVRMPGVSGKENNLATVYWDKHTKDVYLFANQLPKPEQGKQYQLWAIVDGKPVDAGVLGECAALCKLKNIKAAQAFAITLEKIGGSQTPTLEAMYVMGKV
jgi:anti-sigma-K factor RskA